MKKYAKERNTYPAELVWAAAAAAQRINGAYIKLGAEPPDAAEKGIRANRKVMHDFTDNPSLLTAEDLEQGRSVRQHFQGLTLLLLQGRELNEFQRTALAAAEREVIDSALDYAVIASLPSCYERELRSQSARARIEFAGGGLFGAVGDRVTVDVTVTQSRYSQQWNTHFVMALTDQDQAVRFAFKRALSEGRKYRVTGRVREHQDNITVLNRVKLDALLN